MTSEARKDFHHPYEPYEIQQDLMVAIYNCMQDGKIGIFESPTGTGKSLSLLCSSLTWLREVQETNLKSVVAESDDDREPSWVAEQSKEQRRKAAVETKILFEENLRKAREKERAKTQKHHGPAHPAKRRKLNLENESTGFDASAEFGLADYDSDEGADDLRSSYGQAGQGLSSASLVLMEKLGLVYKPTEDEEFDAAEEIKILFCSRTHSQLTQFVHEARKVELPAPPWLAQSDSSDEHNPQTLIKHLPLGSRKHLCINPKVARLGNVAAINEKCLELQGSDIPKDQRCEFLPSKDDESLVNEFRNLGLAKIRDIEDLGDVGRRMETCPYYSSRAMVQPSEMISLPYPLLLQQTARDALDLSLKGHIVIVDEAHNLMDTITNLHSVSISLGQLKQCRSALGTYVQRFRNRLKGQNRVYLAQLVRLLDSIIIFVETRTTTDGKEDGLVTIADLLKGKGVDQINLHKLMTYIQRSKLAYKVQGYLLHEAHSRSTTKKGDQHSASRDSPSSTPVLMHIQSFLQVLGNPSPEGRFFYEKTQSGDMLLKYTLLDPTYHFRAIVDEARAVILAGGTMAPMEDYMTHLFSYVPPERITTWSCGHIIPEENLTVMVMESSLRGIPFEFTFGNRLSSKLIIALGEAILELAKAIPDGMVVFFPSYAYLDKVVDIWKRSQFEALGDRKVWDQLQGTKPIFQETRDILADELLATYTDAIKSQHGGLLLSVVGGKLSEGINFSDQYGRGVVVVGLPFPNMHSAQWKVKLDYIAQSVEKRTGNKEDGKRASLEFYENACMRAVNQSIGRAIRHKGDYAGIVLLDKRYQSQRIRSKLPDWIRQGFPEDGKSDAKTAIERLKVFYHKKNQIVAM